MLEAPIGQGARSLPPGGGKGWGWGWRPLGSAPVSGQGRQRPANSNEIQLSDSPMRLRAGSACGSRPTPIPAPPPPQGEGNRDVTLNFAPQVAQEREPASCDRGRVSSLFVLSPTPPPCYSAARMITPEP